MIIVSGLYGCGDFGKLFYFLHRTFFLFFYSLVHDRNKNKCCKIFISKNLGSKKDRKKKNRKEKKMTKEDKKKTTENRGGSKTRNGKRNFCGNPLVSQLNFHNAFFLACHWLIEVFYNSTEIKRNSDHSTQSPFSSIFTHSLYVSFCFFF